MNINFNCKKINIILIFINTTYEKTSCLEDF